MLSQEQDCQDEIGKKNINTTEYGGLCCTFSYSFGTATCKVPFVTRNGSNDKTEYKRFNKPEQYVPGQKIHLGSLDEFRSGNCPCQRSCYDSTSNSEDTR